MNTTKVPLPLHVRQYFAKLGRIGGQRGSKEDKARAGRLGGRRLVEKLKARKVAGAC